MIELKEYLYWHYIDIVHLGTHSNKTECVDQFPIDLKGKIINSEKKGSTREEIKIWKIGLLLNAHVNPDIKFIYGTSLTTKLPISVSSNIWTTNNPNVILLPLDSLFFCCFKVLRVLKWETKLS